MQDPFGIAGPASGASGAALQYAAEKAPLLTAAYHATSDKTCLQKAIDVYESLRLKWPKNGSVLNAYRRAPEAGGTALSEAAGQRLNAAVERSAQ